MQALLCTNYYWWVRAGIFRLEQARAVKIPSRVEPSWGTLIFELTIPIISMSIILMNICKKIDFIGHNLIIFNPILLKWLFKTAKSKFQLVFGQFLVSSWVKKVHEPSQAELKILQLELWLEPARLELITRF